MNITASTRMLSLAVSFVFTAAEPLIADGRHSEVGEAPKMITWSVLAPENGKPFTDPFAKLTSDQLADVSYVARVRRLIYEQKISADGVDATKSEEISRKLANQGVDIAWLMAQRGRVSQYRKSQIDELSKGIAATLRGREVTLTGYVIPYRFNKGLVTEFFLVPSAAACSHESAPPRIQVVFVTTEQGFARPEKNIAVRVTGSVEAKARSGTVSNGTGRMPIRSAYMMASANIETHEASRQ